MVLREGLDETENHKIGNVYLNLGKDADSKHSPDAADAVGDERAAWIIQVWLAVEELDRISFFI